LEDMIIWLHYYLKQVEKPAIKRGRYFRE